MREYTVAELRAGKIPGVKRPKRVRVIALIRPEVRSVVRSMVLRVPVEIVSESNTREHWRKRHARNGKQRREVVQLAELVHPTHRPPPADEGGWTMRFTRIAPSKLDPGNLGASFKHVQDAICAWLGVKNERDARYTAWSYEQRSEGVRLYGCEIEVTWC